MKFLICVDMQKDFTTGALANEKAQAIAPKISDYMKSFNGIIICTRDTHSSDYLETQEGKLLPIEHCIQGTDGWDICPEVMEAVKQLNADGNSVYAFNKPTFGYASELAKFINNFKAPITEIIFCGTVTSICVVSNVLGLKEQFPETKISVISDLCADLTDENHNAALAVMKACQVNII